MLFFWTLHSSKNPERTCYVSTDIKQKSVFNIVSNIIVSNDPLSFFYLFYFLLLDPIKLTSKTGILQTQLH